VLVHTYIGFVEMSSANEAMEQEDQIKPLWRYVTKLRKTPGGGNVMIKWNLCEISLIGQWSNFEDTQFKEKNVSLPGEGKQTQDGAPPKVPSPLEKVVNLKGRDGIDTRIARMFFS